MSILTIVLSILLPPLAVFLKHGVGTELLISILLTLIGWLPGVIYVFYVNSK
ncbi:YqaE/Pmp3 family membrane protein [uncultured Winogradskyella sp.]|uniref:YqaE/Pmp3 family membrane protein n=1 Tax=uncultured Winogradskyella sp. TaxID=395353 RepID=UPI0030EBF353